MKCLILIYSNPETWGHPIFMRTKEALAMSDVERGHVRRQDVGEGAVVIPLDETVAGQRKDSGGAATPAVVVPEARPQTTRQPGPGHGASSGLRAATTRGRR